MAESDAALRGNDQEGNRDQRVVKDSLARDMIEVHGTEAASTIARNNARW